MRWTEPSSLGSDGFLGYTLEVDDGAGGAFTNVKSDGSKIQALEYDVVNLKTDTPYNLRVRASNAAGDSSWTVLANASTLADNAIVPNTPAPPTLISKGTEEMTVAWVVPEVCIDLLICSCACFVWPFASFRYDWHIYIVE